MDKTILTSTLLLGLAGILAMNFKQLLTWIGKLIMDSLFFTLKVDESSQFFYAVQNYITVEQKGRIKNYYYRTIYDNFIDGETTRDISLFYNRGLIISDGLIISKINTAMTNSTTPYKNEKQTFYIYTWRKKNLNKFVNHIDNTFINKRIRYYFNNNGEIMVYGNVIKKTFNNIFLNADLKELIFNDVNLFQDAKDKYESLGLKYKRTYLFYGVAGGGKSSIATAIANHTKRDILAINLSKDMTDSTLISLIGKRPSKSIVLFEDIDCLFEELNRVVDPSKKDEKDKTQMMKVTLSCLLNILDGSYTPHDVIFIITTNHLEKLDPALKRDGRINMLLEIGLPNKTTKAEYVKHIAAHNPKFNPDTVDLDKDITISTLEKNLF